MQVNVQGRPIAVVDIDGVLADVRHRLHHLAARPKDWAGFFAAASHDPVLEKGRETARELAKVCDLVYLSGRPESCREDTATWLERHGMPDGELHLRRSNDRRPARVLKIETLDRLSEQAPVTVLVDDDPAVCEAARAAGYDVLPATWMGDQVEQQVLVDAQETEGRT